MRAAGDQASTAETTTAWAASVDSQACRSSPRQHLVLAPLAVGAVAESIGGTLRNDTITGTAADDRIDGLAGNDTINGRDGFDVI